MGKCKCKGCNKPSKRTIKECEEFANQYMRELSEKSESEVRHHLNLLKDNNPLAAGAVSFAMKQMVVLCDFVELAEIMGEYCQKVAKGKLSPREICFGLECYSRFLKAEGKKSA